jgi:hypothetical protein
VQVKCTVTNTADKINDLEANLTRINQGNILIRKMESIPSAMSRVKTREIPARFGLMVII